MHKMLYSLVAKLKPFAKKTFIAGLVLFFAVAVQAQAADEKVQMADGMRSSGKIYVVVAVLLTVLIGLFLYLIRLDKKITRLEKDGVEH